MTQKINQFKKESGSLLIHYPTHRVNNQQRLQAGGSLVPLSEAFFKIKLLFFVGNLVKIIDFFDVGNKQGLG